jgi:hypothetical protein
MTTNEHRILHAGQALKRTTGLEAEIHPVPAGQNRAADAIFELATNQRKHRFCAEIKAVDRFEPPALIKAQGKTHREPLAGRTLPYP